jgi:hypothetical protein
VDGSYGNDWFEGAVAHPDVVRGPGATTGYPPLYRSMCCLVCNEQGVGVSQFCRGCWAGCWGSATTYRLLACTLRLTWFRAFQVAPVAPLTLLTLSAVRATFALSKTADSTDVTTQQ